MAIRRPIILLNDNTLSELPESDRLPPNGYLSIRTQNGISDTPTSADENGLISYTNNNPVTVTIDASILNPLMGFDLIAGSGSVTLVPAVGTTFIPGGFQTLRTQGSGASVVCINANTIWVVGDFTSGIPNSWSSFSIIVPNNRFEHEEVISAVGVTPTDIIEIRFAPANDLNENTPDFLDVISLHAVAGTNEFKIYLNFSTPQNGIINLLYRK